MHARDGTIEPRNIDSVTVQRDFYTYYDSLGRPREDIEVWFGVAIETRIARLLQALRAGRPIHPDHRRPLARFAASSLLRTATVRALMAQIDSHLRPALVLFDAATKANVDLLEMSSTQRTRLLAGARHALERLPVDDAEERRSRLRTMLRKIDEWTRLMASWNWEACRSPTPRLISGDAPVVVLGASPDRGWSGVLPENSSILLPISPSVLLVASPHPLVGTGQITDELEHQVNTGIVRNAYKLVLHHPQMPWPNDLFVPAEPQPLPDPQINLRRSEPGATPTFPATYPAIEDPVIAGLLHDLGATDTVQ
jgi:hypothetical protein